MDTSIENLTRLAYAHENGIVLVDIIQKCVIINANLGELYGGASSLAASNRDISIQPYATSSILQHHYSQTGASPSLSSSASGGEHLNKNSSAATAASSSASKSSSDNGSGMQVQIDPDRKQDNGATSTKDAAADHHDACSIAGQVSL